MFSDGISVEAAVARIISIGEPKSDLERRQLAEFQAIVDADRNRSFTMPHRAMKPQQKAKGFQNE